MGPNQVRLVPGGSRRPSPPIVQIWSIFDQPIVVPSHCVVPPPSQVKWYEQGGYHSSKKGDPPLLTHFCTPNWLRIGPQINAFSLQGLGTHGRIKNNKFGLQRPLPLSKDVEPNLAHQNEYMAC